MAPEWTAAGPSEDERDAEGRPEPPPRQGSRAERRERTLRALADGGEAACAYCGAPLPPAPPKGGRPTPYCPANTDRYGKWGTKTITCAMLDEHREIWMQVYGPDQPMTKVDLDGLRLRLADLKAVLSPVHEEIAGLEKLAAAELARALAARETADAKRAAAEEAARTAVAERDEAVAAAAEAREHAGAAQAEHAAAESRASEAIVERDRAITDRDAARGEATRAHADRQAALDQAAQSHQRITELQNTLAEERASTLDRIDALRRDHEQAQRDLRRTLSEDYDQRLRSQSDDFTQRLQAAQTAAERRSTELTERLAEATRAYADNLGPLHDKVRALTEELATLRAAAHDERARNEQLRADLTEVLQHDDDALRASLHAALHRHDPVAPSTRRDNIPEGGVG
ncbi:hypothetical protein GCM10010470_30570 [Saccharopolyspora taberi]|uniref:Chromosome segregation ATPase n=2 Tax=Saccharopolyspora taberi TaxID=60895 RepID=A0ABN3VD49_9PSEU